jgi:hypothetical protein
MALYLSREIWDICAALTGLGIFVPGTRAFKERQSTFNIQQP